MLTFLIYIRGTGGIVTAEETKQMDFGVDDMIQFEQMVMPPPRDSDNSVWYNLNEKKYYPSLFFRIATT